MDKAIFETAHLAALNDQQRAAVEAVNGPVLLLAVPGSGKTTVLITRLGYMTEVCGIAPEAILTMTYTVAATQEMRARFAARFGGELAARLEFRTINGVAARIIALYSRMYGRTPPELIRNESETTPLLMRLWQDTNHEYPAESTVKDLRTAITYIKNMCLTDAELDELETDIENLSDLYRGYQKALKAAHKMDYDDQLCFALQILRGAPAVAAAFRKRYKYFCVDESQDTSKVQHEIIRVLAQESGNIFMVGDEDQSIYGFRAAYPQALMDFEKTYPGAQILLMEQNYRSTEPILEAANRFVARNRYRRPKTIAPTQGPGAPLQIVTVPRRADQLPFLFETAQHCGAVPQPRERTAHNRPVRAAGHPLRLQGSGPDLFYQQDRPRCDRYFHAGRTPRGWGNFSALLLQIRRARHPRTGAVCLQSGAAVRAGLLDGPAE